MIAGVAERRLPDGRKPVLTPHQQKEARKRLEAGETQRSVARSYNISQSTVSRLPRDLDVRHGFITGIEFD
jgi:DNA invertase Pin-like site-specific DNA recombinase